MNGAIVRSKVVVELEHEFGTVGDNWNIGEARKRARSEADQHARRVLQTGLRRGDRVLSVRVSDDLQLVLGPALVTPAPEVSPEPPLRSVADAIREEAISAMKSVAALYISDEKARAAALTYFVNRLPLEAAKP